MISHSRVTNPVYSPFVLSERIWDSFQANYQTLGAKHLPSTHNGQGPLKYGGYSRDRNYGTKN